MSDSLYDLRARIAEIGRLMYERHLTDAAGGNISARAGDVICVTPRYAGSKYQWRLRPEQIVVADLHGHKLEGEGEISREAKVHFKLLTEFPDGKAVVHGHPRYVMVFAMAGRPIVPVLENTLKFGMIRVCRFAPAHSAELPEHIAAELRGQEAAIRKQAAAVIAPWHGLFVLGKDLDSAYDAAERIDVNAQCILMSRLLPGEPVDLEAIHAQLREQMRK
ncbi:MAG: class II aldolase/adducin family protein [Anaerolineae bacterium]|nr:class II aldolase/adducin family protein [Thermoflexales bacterium]MDW8407223.1 class II aldolase/adducin family protein [Anaerolineae bacterium]